MNFGRTIADHAAERPDKIAILSIAEGSLTYRQLTARLDTISLELRAAGLGQLARVGVLLDHNVEAAVVELGVASACISAPLDPAYTDRELLAALETYALDALVVARGDEARGRRLAAAGRIALLRPVGAPGDAATIGLELVEAGESPRDGREADAGFAFLMRSSGTTGQPKIIPVTHANVLALPNNMRALFDVTEMDRSACTLPLYYSAGLTQTLLSSLVIGGSAAVPAKAARENLLSWFPALQPTWLSTSPATLRRMLDLLPEDEAVSLPGLRFVICGASLVPDSLRAEAEARLGVPVLETFGTTESGVMTASGLPPRPRKYNTIGLAPPDEVAILGPDGERLGPGETGEIGLRGAHVTPGYIGIPTPEDGWLRIGDLGVIDEDGFLTIVGRVKEMINRGGAKISPYEVELAALEHPAVAEAAAYGAPHPRLGEAVALAVVFAPGMKVAASELKGFLAERIAGFKVPQAVVALDALPRGPTGKIVRDRLAEAHAGDAAEPVVPPYDILDHQILDVWRRLLKRDDIGVEDDFFEAGGDSLLGQEMLLEVEALARRKIPLDRITYPITIRSLHGAISAELERDGPAEQQRVTRASEGDGAPFFFCHGDYLTRGLYALKLTDLLGLERPVHLVHPGFEPGVHTSLPRIAAGVLPEMIKQQPEGPFRLGGYCNGGLLAWEIAHQLRTAGREVEVLAMVEPMSLNTRPWLRAARRVAAVVERLAPPRDGAVRQMTRLWKLTTWGPSMGEIAKLAVAKLRRAVSGRRPPPAAPASPGATAYEEAISASVFEAMADYAPPPLDIKVHCFIATEGDDRADFDPSGWRALTPALTVSSVPGNHQGCVTLHLETLAAKLKSVAG